MFLLFDVLNQTSALEQGIILSLIFNSDIPYPIYLLY